MITKNEQVLHPALLPMIPNRIQRDKVGHHVTHVSPKESYPLERKLVSVGAMECTEQRGTSPMHCALHCL